MAGAPGIEPGITGSKPVALPLGYAPFGRRKIGGFKSYRNRFKPNRGRISKKYCNNLLLTSC